MDQEIIKKYAERVRKELHELVDRQIDNFLKRRGNEKSGISFERTWSLDMPASYFKGMNKIDDGIYFESYFDTEYLLKMMKERVLDRVGYDSGAVRLQIYEPKKELTREYEIAQHDTQELPEEETDEKQDFSLTI